MTTLIFTLASSLFISFGLNDDNYKECNNYKECAYKTVDNAFVSCNGLSGCSEGTINIGQSDGYIDCNGQTSCYNSRGLSSQGDISCQGYKSCRYSKSIIAEGDIECSGWNSCDHEGKQESEYTVSSYSDISCTGSASCGYNTMTSDEDTNCIADKSCYQTDINAGNDIACDADKSCAKSTLFATNSINCNGKGGCYESDITSSIVNAFGMYGAHNAKISAEQINGFGVRSLTFAEIESDNLPKMEVNLFGEEAGTGAEIYCNENSKCVINCKASGCKELTIYCDTENGAKCDITPESCNNEGNDNENCPILKHGKKEKLQLHVSSTQKDIFTNEVEMEDGGENIKGHELTDEIIDGLLVGDTPYDFVQGNGIKIMTSNSILYSNILTGFIVFLVTVVMVDCYFKAKYGNK